MHLSPTSKLGYLSFKLMYFFSITYLSIYEKKNAKKAECHYNDMK